MNRPAEIDYVLDIVCQHKGQGWAEDEPEQLVSRIVHRPRPDDGSGVVRKGFLEWLEAEHPTTGYPPAFQTYFGEAGRLGRSASGGVGVPDLVPGMTSGTRWRFWCRTCDLTVVYVGDKLGPALERLRMNEVPRITLAGLIDVVT